MSRNGLSIGGESWAVFSVSPLSQSMCVRASLTSDVQSAILWCIWFYSRLSEGAELQTQGWLLQCLWGSIWPETRKHMVRTGHLCSRPCSALVPHSSYACIIFHGSLEDAWAREGHVWGNTVMNHRTQIASRLTCFDSVPWALLTSGSRHFHFNPRPSISKCPATLGCASKDDHNWDLKAVAILHVTLHYIRMYFWGLERWISG